MPFKFDIAADRVHNNLQRQSNRNILCKVSCTPRTEDPIEQVVCGTGGTTLRYDSTSGQFVYNWQTPKEAGICYDTTFTDQSGGSLTAHFKTM
ncbi:MAG: PxKF domain-containing protein [Thermoproteota archaeon]|nr:PxKF domain-containing protein [Thermoproteota archaeon]